MRLPILSIYRGNIVRSKVFTRCFTLSKSNLEDRTGEQHGEFKPTKREFTQKNELLIKENLRKWIGQQYGQLPRGNGKNFAIFKTLKHTAIRNKLPEAPSFLGEMKPEEIGKQEKRKIVSYMQNLTRYTYPHQVKNVSDAVEPVFKTYGSIPEIQLEYLYYQIKSGNHYGVRKLLATEPQYHDHIETYIYMLDMINLLKNSKYSIKFLRQFTRELVKRKVSVNNELLYKLYYSLTLDCRRYLVKLLEDRMDISALLYDHHYLTITDYDTLVEKLLDKEIDFTYSSYIQLNKLMVKENRVEETLHNIKKLLSSRRVELPASLCHLTVETILTHYTHLALPASLYLQRLTGVSSKRYTLDRIASLILASGVFNESSIDLLNLIYETDKRHAGQRRKELSVSIGKKENSLELLEYLNPKNKSEQEYQKFEQTGKLFRCRYQANDVAFKPGFDIVDYEPIFRLFPSYNRFATVRGSLLESTANGEKLNDLWSSKIEPFAKSNPPLFNQLSCMLVTDVLLKKKEYCKIISFVTYLRERYHVDISYNSYLETIKNIVRDFKGTNVDIEESQQIKLAILLTQTLQFQQHEFLQVFIKQNPIMEKVLGFASAKKDRLTNPHKFKALVNENRWDINQPPEF